MIFTGQKRNIILAEDHQVVRDGLKLLLELSGKYEVALGAASGEEVIAALDSGVHADLILSDINMPDMDGISLIGALKQKNIEIPVLIITMLEDIPHMHRAISAGAAGFLTKDVESEELFFALSVVISGGRYVCASLAMQIIDRVAASAQIFNESRTSEEFSQREIEILHLIGEGMTSSEIADKLYLSSRTVEGHRQHLIEKTGVTNAASLIRFAYRHGLIR